MSFGVTGLRQETDGPPGEQPGPAPIRVNTSAYAYITVSYGGYSSLSWQIKQILGKNVNQVHLIEIIGIK